MAMKTNVIVMSEAGKPIFSRFGSEEEVSRQCGLLQAIRTNVEGNKALDLGEIQSIHSDKSLIVFMTVGGGSITLVSITQIEQENGAIETTVHARLQLENLYAQLIFSLTDQVQAMFVQNPSFDLRTMLSATETNLMHGILDESGLEVGGNPGPFMVASAPVVFPISSRLRDKASRTLQSIGGAVPNTAFALLLVGDKLLTLVQSSFWPHQLRVSDLHLILNFIRKQSYLSSSELWVPMCLPRFNSSGFLYSYIKCIDDVSKFSLVLISNQNTTEQFQLFRNASVRIQEELDLPADTDSVISVTTTKRIGPDIAWERYEDSLEEEYVNIGGHERQSSERSLLLDEVRQSYELSSYTRIAERYFEKEEPLLHFLFRVDIPIKNSSRHSSPHEKGHLTQCMSPTLTSSFASAASRRRLFTMYQKLGLRLRLGCATVESSMDALDMISQDNVTDSEKHFPRISCPSIGLVASPPNIHSVTYCVEGNEIFLAMNGRGFELYMVTSNSIPVKRAAGIGSKLVRRLQADEKKLFLSNPLTWR